MKLKKISAAALVVLLLAVMLAGCYNPTTVGTVGETEIPAGLYLFYQLAAYNNAVNEADGGEDVTITSKNVLDYEVEGTPAAEWIAQKLDTYLGEYAFVEEEFARLGLEFDSWDEYYIDYSASQNWSSSSSIYERNGISYESYFEANANNYKAGLLFDALYVADGGERKISDAELEAGFNDNFYRLDFINLPTSKDDGTALSAEEKTAINAVGQKMIEMVNGGSSIEEAYLGLYAEVQEIVGVEGTQATAPTAEDFAGKFKTNVLTYSGDTEFSLTDDFLAAVKSTPIFEYGYYANEETGQFTLYYRQHPSLEPVEDTVLDEEQDVADDPEAPEDSAEENPEAEADGPVWSKYISITAQLLKGDEFTEYLEAGGAALARSLDEKAATYYSVDKIIL